MCVILQVHKHENENALCFFKIVTTLESADNFVSQNIRCSPVLKAAELRSGAFLMTIFGETQGTAGAVSLRAHSDKSRG